VSFNVSDAVWKSGMCKGNALLVLLALAHWSDESGLSWPSMDTLGRKTRQSSRNVQYCVRQLERTGILTIEPGQKGRRNYRIAMHKLMGAQKLRGNGDVTGAKIAEVGAQKLHVGGAKTSDAIRKTGQLQVKEHRSGGKKSKSAPSHSRSKNSLSETQQWAQALANALHIVESNANLEAIRLGINAEAALSQISLKEATQLIRDYSIGEDFFTRSGKAPKFYFEDCFWRTNYRYTCRELDKVAKRETGCLRHPDSGNHPDTGRCWSCVDEGREAVAS
jgi:hypothetical protein